MRPSCLFFVVASSGPLTGAFLTLGQRLKWAAKWVRVATLKAVPVALEMRLMNARRSVHVRHPKELHPKSYKKVNVKQKSLRKEFGQNVQKTWKILATEMVQSSSSVLNCIQIYSEMYKVYRCIQGAAGRLESVRGWWRDWWGLAGMKRSRREEVQKVI